LGNIFSEKYS